MNLEHVRKHIDELDEQILSLLNQRLENSLEVARLKKEHAAQLFAPARESRIIDRLSALSDGPMTKKQLVAIYREIISASIELQGGISIAFLGPETTNTHQAALQRFGASASYQPYETFDEIIQAVEKGTATYGLLPIENTREGTVTAAQDLLVDTSLTICAETVLKVNHHLLGHGDLSACSTVYSHPQALAQCDEWLSKHLPNAARFSCASTASAVERAASEEGAFAVGSLLAGEKFSVPVQAECIQDQVDNQTRFIVLSRHGSPVSGEDKTSIIFGLRHEVGALNHVLTLLEEHCINLLRIESRPHRSRRWEYLFFLDVEGHMRAEALQKTLASMEAHCVFIKVLGSYPRAQEDA